VAATVWTTHLVVRRWTRSDLAGMVAAAAILTNTWYVHGFVARTPHLAALQYLPLLALVAATPAARPRAALLLAGLVVLQSLTDLVYVAPAVFAVLGVLATIRVVRRGTRAAGVRLMIALGLAGLALAPVYAGYLLVRSENPALASQSVWRTAPPLVVVPELFFRPGTGPAVFLPPVIVLVVLGLLALAGARLLSAPVPDRAGCGVRRAGRHELRRRARPGRRAGHGAGTARSGRLRCRVSCL
jgi:hypothetical protein